MIHTMDCKANITAQDAIYPTYKKVDCTLHTNANNDGFHGKLIDCTVAITNVLVTACRSWNQGIRLVVTIDDVDVSNALIGSLNIQHDKNMISTASLNLGKTTYSPRTNSHIDLEKVIVITAYINGQEKKLFTGLTDEPSAENIPAFRVIITGRDYGKKLLDKNTTLISVQDLADSIKRNDLIKYLAEQAGITSMDIPEMDAVTIDNSFQHQSIWDMIQKEAIVELYWVKFSEDNVMQLKLDEIKSDTSLYPTPDWSYDEDRIIRLGYKKSRVGINKIIVLGKTDSSIIENWDENPFSLSGNITFAADEDIEDYTANIGGFNVIAKRSANWLNYIGYKLYFYKNDNDLDRLYFESLSGDVTVTEGGGTANWEQPNITFNGRLQCPIAIEFFADKPRVQCSLTFSITGTALTQSLETQYDQISASVTDLNSIEKYGERDGGSIEFPLLETEAQCKAVGSKIIRDSHRMGQQADFLISFNPLIQTGQTIAITDKKIGITERYYIESLSHNIDINEGKVKARTQIGGVYYT